MDYGPNHFQGTITRIVPASHAWLVHVHAGVKLTAALTNERLRTCGLLPGKTCELSGIPATYTDYRLTKEQAARGYPRAATTPNLTYRRW